MRLGLEGAGRTSVWPKVVRQLYVEYGETSLEKRGEGRPKVLYDHD